MDSRQTFTTEQLHYLRLLAKQYPTIQAAGTEIIKLRSVLNLPKGTEHFMSDIHGEYEAFLHILNSGSGEIRVKLEMLYENVLSRQEIGDLATLIYYPKAKLALVADTHEDLDGWYHNTLMLLVQFCRFVSTKHTRSRVRSFIPAGYEQILDELLHMRDEEGSRRGQFETMLDTIKAAGLSSIAVGKIHDIFAGYGDTEYVYNTSNTNGMEHAAHYAAQDFHGLCFVNLVDFDMLYGHRRDIDGYAAALTEFDGWLADFLPTLGEDDLVMITADHGCDPAYTATTDHTREYVPLLVLGKKVKPVNLGTRIGFADIAATVTELLGVEYKTTGKSFAKEII